MFLLQRCRRAACALVMAFALWPMHAAAQDAPPLAVQQALNRIAADLFAPSPQPAAAIEELKMILADYPELAEAHMLLGFAYRAQGTPDVMGEAVGELRQAIALKPSLLLARLALARVYLDLSRQTRAREELEEALELAPGRPELLSLLGETERQLGDPKRSAELNRQALDADGTNAQARYYLALALLDLQQYEDATRELEAVVGAGGAPAEAHLALGSAYVASGRMDAGLKALREAATLDPARPETHVQLARAYRLNGQHDEALAHLRLAIPPGQELSVLFKPIAPEVYMEEGLIRLEQNDLDGAAEAFERVLALDASHEPAKQQLAGVRTRLQKAAPRNP
jgi:tetratricopeptide (TPR) repeat protein